MTIAVSIWAVVLFASLGFGVVAAAGSRSSVRHRLWLGFSLIAVTGAAVSLVPPGGMTHLYRIAVVVMSIVGVGFVVVGWVRSRSQARARVALAVTVLVVALVTAFMALGEVRNYDTGLYHLQLVALAAEEGVSPGLAQLHDRFGFTSSLWSIGAQLELASTPILGFRLVTGLFLLLFVFELLNRLMVRSYRASVGTWILATGSVVLIAYGFSYAGRTFAGIGQDWIVAVLWLVTSAYLADWLQYRRRADLATAIVVAALAGSVRPFAWLLLVGVLIVGVIYRRSEVRSVALMWWSAILAGMWLIVTAVRDTLASGWLLFPLGLLPIPVPWRVDDPGPTAEAVTLWARAPFDMELGETSWDWFPGWVARVLTDWVVVWLVALLLLAVVLLTVRRRFARRESSVSGPIIAPLLVIQVVALAAWFYAAPDPRFGWGPLLALGGLAVAGAAGPGLRQAVVDRGGWLVWMPLVLVLVSFAFAVVRDPGWWLDRQYAGSPVAVVPLPVVDVEIVGDVARTVGPDDRCWRTAVPCVPWYAGID